MPATSTVDAPPCQPSAEVGLASWWGSWLEVDAACRPDPHEGRRRASVPEIGRSLIASTSRASLRTSRRASTSTATVCRFRPDSHGNVANIAHVQDGRSLHAWLCPRPLEVQPPDMKRLSAPVATTCPAKPALKRASVALPVDAEFRRNRRVSFTETPETRDVSPVSRSHGEGTKTETSQHVEPGIQPADEAFAAFRVRPVFEQAETELPLSLREHEPRLTRYHSLGHHHHPSVMTAAALRAPTLVDPEALPSYPMSDSSTTYAATRARLSDVQGQGAVRKVPHFRIRIRKVYTRAKVLHPHPHLHHMHNGPLVLPSDGPIIASTSSPVILHMRVPDVATDVAPLPVPLETPTTPLTAAALQRHEERSCSSRKWLITLMQWRKLGFLPVYHWV
ncbi:unnamed protein product [Effrenium voratum]|nr:unnamed protein product [Effrenium voratum]